MKHSYIIVDDNHESILKTQANAMRFENLGFSGYANTYDDALNLILEQQPSLIFMEINPEKKESNLSLALINELYRYLTVIPKIIVTTNTQEMIFKAMEYGVADYLIKPLNINDFRKSVLKFEKSVSVTANNQIVVPNANTVSVSQNIIEEIKVKEEIHSETLEKTTVSPETETLIEEKTSEIIEEITSEETLVEETIPEITEETTETEEEIPAEIITSSEETLEETPEIAEEEIQEELSVENFVSDNEIVLEENTIVEKETTQEETISEEIQEEETEPETEETEEEQDDDEVQLLDGKNTIAQQEQPLIICVKSYGDYRYIDSRDILYFEADNNSTDIHLKDGEMVTAFKTLKHFENVLPTDQFLRIHNSYIINVSQVARIHTGNAVCFIKNSNIKLPFSKSYKENVELIIHRIASGNYIEI